VANLAGLSANPYRHIVAADLAVFNTTAFAGLAHQRLRNSSLAGHVTKCATAGESPFNIKLKGIFFPRGVVYHSSSARHSGELQTL
jgi:hypothetical protein